MCRLGVTAAMTIEAEIKTAYRRKQGDIFIVGAQGQVQERLRRFRVQNTLPDNNFVPSCYAAFDIILTLLDTHVTTVDLFDPNREEEGMVSEDDVEKTIHKPEVKNK